jgi:hypothetical protein
MTTPALSVSIVKQGRMYPWLPQDPSGWTRNRWGSVDPANVPDGVTMYPSVTNVLSGFSDGGDGLLYWAGEQAIRAMYRDGFPAEVDRAVELHRGAFREARDKRAEAGTRAHTLAEALASDLPLPSGISEEDEQYADAFMRFWTDFDPQPHLVEMTVYGDGYAGTADMVARLKGGDDFVVVDYKTRGKPETKPKVYDKTRMQLAALATSLDVAIPTLDGWHVEPTEPMRAMAVILYPDGTYHAEELENVWRWKGAFDGLLDVWRFTKGTPAPPEGGAGAQAARAEGSSASMQDRGA